MGYEIPDFTVPLEPKSYLRLKKYSINACSFVADRFLYSRLQANDFLLMKKRIPEIVTVYENSEKDDKENLKKGEQRKIVDFPIIEEVFTELDKQEVFNDRKFAKMKAESYILRRKGESFIRRELLSKKFDEETVTEVLVEVMEENSDIYDDSFRSAADSIIRTTNFTKKKPQARKQLFLSTLVRKGFDMSDIFTLINDEEYAHYFVYD